MQIQIGTRSARRRASEIPEARRNNFNIIRFFAALLVMYGHMFPILGIAPHNIQHSSVSTYGVLLLFSMGGYLIANSWNSDPSILRYSIRRITRLYPAYIVLLLVSVYLVGPLVTSVSRVHYFEWGAMNYLWSNLRLQILYQLPGVFLENPYVGSVNGSLWTMPVEAALYVLAVVILLWAGKQSGKRRSAVLIGTAAVTSLIGWFIQLMLNRNALAHITWIPSIMWQCFIVTPYFLIGMAYTLPEIRRFLSLQIAAALMAVILMFEFPPEVSPFILYFIMPYIMFSFAFAPTPVFYRFGSKRDITFGMYLYGFMVQQLVVYWFMQNGWDLSFWPVFILAVLGTLLLAVLSWYLVEKPANALAKKLISISKRRSK